jgi:hypothetical protein
MQTFITNAMRVAKNIKAKSHCSGRALILKCVEDDLLCFIFELREQGMGVITTFMVVLKAATLSRSFREKSRNTQYRSTRCFIQSHGLVHRMSTHESQKDPRAATTAREALDFVESVHPKLMQACCHQDYIINMDQTPVPFTYNSKTWIRHQFHSPTIQRRHWNLLETSALFM